MKIVENYNPLQASQINALIASAVTSVELKTPELEGHEKRLVVANLVYDALDAWYEYPPFVDFVAKSVIIPLIPEAIDHVVKWLNDTGMFRKEPKDV